MKTRDAWDVCQDFFLSFNQYKQLYRMRQKTKFCTSLLDVVMAPGALLHPFTVVTPAHRIFPLRVRLVPSARSAVRRGTAPATKLLLTILAQRPSRQLSRKNRAGSRQTNGRPACGVGAPATLRVLVHARDLAHLGDLRGNLGVEEGVQLLQGKGGLALEVRAGQGRRIHATLRGDGHHACGKEQTPVSSVQSECGKNWGEACSRGCSLILRYRYRGCNLIPRWSKRHPS